MSLPPHSPTFFNDTASAEIYAEKGEAALVSADDFRPEYLRIPQAERERGDKRNYKVFVE